MEHERPDQPDMQDGKDRAMAILSFSYMQKRGHCNTTKITPRSYGQRFIAGRCVTETSTAGHRFGGFHSHVHFVSGSLPTCFSLATTLMFITRFTCGANRVMDE